MTMIQSTLEISVRCRKSAVNHVRYKEVAYYAGHFYREKMQGLQDVFGDI